MQAMPTQAQTFAREKTLREERNTVSTAAVLNLHASQTHNEQGPTVPQAIRDAMGKAGGYTFLQGDSETFLSFTDISLAIDARARQLLAAGLEKGDAVGLVLPDPQDFLLTFMGALSVGVVPVPMYPPMSFGKLDAYADTAARILDAAQAVALITEKRVQSVLWSLVDRVETLEQVLVVNELKDAPGPAPDLSHIQPGDTAFLQFTSGSTAEPKGVVVTHQSLLANLHAIMKYGLQIDEDDVAISWLPMYHDMGLIGFMLAPMWYAVPTVFIPTLEFVKHPTKWMETVSRFRGTITFAPNFAFAVATRRTSESKLAKLDLSRLKALGCGAEPNHPGTLNAFTQHFAKAGLKAGALLPCYGMAEATLAMSFTPLGVGLRTDRIDADAYHREGRAVPATEATEKVIEVASCGYALPGHQLLVVDEREQPVPDRVVGEIIFKGPSVTPGYYRHPEKTAETFTSVGLHTGDLGYLVDGELFVCGRKKDVIILNGRNYDPQTIEWEVAEIEGVRRGNVVAFSLASATTEKLVVVVETKLENPEVLRQQIVARVRENLNLNVEDVVLLRPGQLPKTSSGKLQRRQTRALYERGELTRQGVRTMGTRAESLSLAKHISLSLMAKVRHRIRRRTRTVLSAVRIFQGKSQRKNDSRATAPDHAVTPQ